MTHSSPSKELILSYEAAAAAVRSQTEELRRGVPPAAMQVDLLAALGRVLAEPVVADRDQPPFARSTRDGFACRASELQAGGRLKVIGLIRAGEAWSGPSPASFEAVEIMTGAPVPEGLDCVIMIENVIASATESGREIAPAEGVTIRAGDNVVPAGSEARKGRVILPGGARLTPSRIGAAASCGYTSVTVYARPRVAILSTGDELVDIADTPASYQIRNSNSNSLAAQVLAAEGEPVMLPIVRDSADETEAAIRGALGCDLLLLSGGVSVGRFDLVEVALSRIGVEFFFTGARIQPGKPVVFGKVREPERYFFGLPGNPVSTLVTFALFVQPLIDALGGADPEGPRFVRAQLAETIQVRTGLTRFLPARMQWDAPTPMVTPVRWQGSGDLAHTANSNCFLVVPPERESLAAGETIAVLLS